MENRRLEEHPDIEFPAINILIKLECIGFIGIESTQALLHNYCYRNIKGIIPHPRCS